MGFNACGHMMGGRKTKSATVLEYFDSTIFNGKTSVSFNIQEIKLTLSTGILSFNHIESGFTETEGVHVLLEIAIDGTWRYIDFGETVDLRPNEKYSIRIGGKINGNSEVKEALLKSRTAYFILMTDNEIMHDQARVEIV